LPHAPSAEPSASTAPLAPNQASGQCRRSNTNGPSAYQLYIATLNAITSSACDQIQRSRSSCRSSGSMGVCATSAGRLSRRPDAHPSISRMTISSRPACTPA
jgi:hypothetical protein